MASVLTADADARLSELDRRLRRALELAPTRNALLLSLRGLERRVRALRLVLAAQPSVDGTAYLDALFFVAGDLAGATSAARGLLHSALAEHSVVLECEQERDAIYAASDTQLPEIPGGLEARPW